MLCVACWLYVGLATFRGGHFWLCWIGFSFPLLWIIGTFIAPTDAPPYVPPYVPPARYRRQIAQAIS